MINLLSDDKKGEIKAGRTNIILLNYIIMSLVAVGFLAMFCVGAYLVLGVSRTNAQGRVSVNSTNANSLGTVKADAETFRSNLATASQVLSSDTKYSDLLVKIAQAVPSGVILDSLSLDPQTLGSKIALGAHARDKETALALKTNFQKNKELFSDVHFEQISFGGSDSGGNSSAGHPISVQLSVVINKDALK